MTMDSMVAALRHEARDAPESVIVEVFNYGRHRKGLIPLWVGEGDLPTPAFIAKSDLPSDVTANLKMTLLGMPAATGPDVLYTGFADYQDARMERLFADLAALPGLAHAA